MVIGVPRGLAERPREARSDLSPVEAEIRLADLGLTHRRRDPIWGWTIRPLGQILKLLSTRKRGC